MGEGGPGSAPGHRAQAAIGRPPLSDELGVHERLVKVEHERVRPRGPRWGRQARWGGQGMRFRHAPDEDVGVEAVVRISIALVIIAAAGTCGLSVASGLPGGRGGDYLAEGSTLRIRARRNICSASSCRGKDGALGHRGPARQPWATSGVALGARVRLDRPSPQSCIVEGEDAARAPINPRRGSFSSLQRERKHLPTNNAALPFACPPRRRASSRRLRSIAGLVPSPVVTGYARRSLGS